MASRNDPGLGLPEAEHLSEKGFRRGKASTGLEPVKFVTIGFSISFKGRQINFRNLYKHNR